MKIIGPNRLILISGRSGLVQKSARSIGIRSRMTGWARPHLRMKDSPKPGLASTPLVPRLAMPSHRQARDDAEVAALDVLATSVQAPNAVHQDAPMTPWA